MILSAAAFLSGLALDLLWVRCISDVQQRRAFSAASIGVLLYLCTVLSTILIVEKCVLACCAYAAGGWLGTYLGVRWRRP
jgi:hypothetical protein